jgi:aminoglycoside 6'-N-acetyltransferase I
MPAPTIRVTRDDPSLRDTWLRMRCELWPEGSTHEHRLEIDRYFAGERRHLQAVLFAHDTDGCAVGFAELNIRPYAEGCSTDRVAFLEGWYVAAGARGRGFGAALVAEAERWARERGCTEFASDVVAGNTASAAAHRALGFDQVGTIICFRKDLEPRRGP